MIVVTGISHHQANIEIREQVALSVHEEAALTQQLLAHEDIAELFVISTCNRVELVAMAAGSSIEAAEKCERACRGALSARSSRAAEVIYSHRGLAAVRHLVRVASSLDSLVVGEAQILGQLKQGFERARALQAVGPHLHQLFVRTTRGAKRVRNETSIGVGQVSVPSIAIELAGQIFGSLKGRRAVLIGAGEMGQSVARLLTDAGAQLSVLGRDLEKVRPVAANVGGQPYHLSELSRLLVDAEVVVSSTSASEPVMRAEHLAERRKTRRAGNLFCIDLAVPRDIDPKLGELDSVFLYDVDDLSQVAAQSAESRKKEAEAALLIVEQVVADWERHAQVQQVTPTIKALRAKFRLALETELEKSLRGRLRDLDPEQRAALAKMLDAGMNRILHDPVSMLRNEAVRSGASGAEESAGLLSELFDLGEINQDELEVRSVRVPDGSGVDSGQYDDEGHESAECSSSPSSASSESGTSPYSHKVN